MCFIAAVLLFSCVHCEPYYRGCLSRHKCYFVVDEGEGFTTPARMGNLVSTVKVNFFISIRTWRVLGFH